MFLIKGQVQTSHILKLQANRPKLHFRDNGHQSNTFILPNTKPNRLKYYVLNQGTSSTFIFVKIVTIQAKISFSRQGTFQYFHFTEYETKQTKIPFSRQRHFSTFILPNPKPNTFETKSFQYFHFTKYKIKQAHISCFASTDIKHPIYQTCRHIDQNLIFVTRVDPKLSFYRIQN